MKPVCLRTKIRGKVMPVYEYECEKCGVVFDSSHASSETRDNAPPCPSCGASGAKRMFSTFAVSHSPSFGGGKTCCGAIDPSAAGCGNGGSCCGKDK